MDFWKLVKEVLSQDSVLESLSISEGLGVLNNLREMDILNNTLLKKLTSSLLQKITEGSSAATNLELTQFVTVYLSRDYEADVKNLGVDWDSGVAKIEQELVRRAKANSVDSKTFSDLCYSFDKDVPMNKFFELIFPQV